MSITYRFLTDDDREFAFEVDIDRGAPTGEGLPAWTALEQSKCENCPLQGDKYCPPAADLAGVVEAFADHISYANVEVRVESKERTISKRCDMQTGIASLMGLVMATSGCPHLAPLKPLARFHLPFATREETLFRTVGAHLARELVRKARGQTDAVNLDGLRALYAELTIVNTGFTERVRAAATRDASLNAIVNLFSLAVLISLSLDNDLDELAEVVGEPKTR